MQIAFFAHPLFHFAKDEIAGDAAAAAEDDDEDEDEDDGSVGASSDVDVKIIFPEHADLCNHLSFLLIEFLVKRVLDICC